MKKADIGIYGLGIMGQNLALNFADKGYAVVVYNRSDEGEEGVTAGFISSRCSGKNIFGAQDLRFFVESLQSPRKILVMVKSGAPVDAVIKQLLAYLDPGDIIIDGGNSHYRDSARRMDWLAGVGINFIGCGISGGTEAALHGPSLMPGGSTQAWKEVREMLHAIAVRTADGSPCCKWIGPGGSGHFVKMVHNGIEYGMMQMLAEVYDIMVRMLNLDNDRIADIFSAWNDTGLQSYLLGITAEILRKRDEDGQPLIAKIRDSAGNKGTGAEAVIAATELAYPATVMVEAVYARYLSNRIKEREKLSALFDRQLSTMNGEDHDLLPALQHALYCSHYIAYVQGFSMIEAASSAYGWTLNLACIAGIWRKGCIVRSELLNMIHSSFERIESNNIISSLLGKSHISARQTGWRHAVASAITHGIPVPCLASALAFFDGLRSKRLPASLIQLQRDYFGHHGIECSALPEGDAFNVDWNSY